MVFFTFFAMQCKKKPIDRRISSRVSNFAFRPNLEGISRLIARKRRSSVSSPKTSKNSFPGVITSPRWMGMTGTHALGGSRWGRRAAPVMFRQPAASTTCSSSSRLNPSNQGSQQRDKDGRALFYDSFSLPAVLALLLHLLTTCYELSIVCLLLPEHVGLLVQHGERRKWPRQGAGEVVSRLQISRVRNRYAR